ncbi:PD-(D/E)XK nuclease family transposase [Desulfobacterales bacterium HSG2]|nr:PD-(D/E)XK nuclease family transposase [Desulfobacterales bacterium HSG2]
MKTGKTLKFRDRLGEWLYFFNHAHEENEETMGTHYENPVIRRAFTAREALSDDEKERLLAEKREESLMNERYELAAARRKEIAASLLNEGMSPERVMKKVSGGIS